MANPNTAVFPTALATDSTLLVASNRALSKITLPVDASQTSFTVVDGTKFEVPCLVQIDTEIIKVATKTSNVLSGCTRGFAATTATTHGQNSDVKGYVFSYHHNQMAAEVKAIEAALGTNLGNVVTQADQAGGVLNGTFSTLALDTNGVTAGTYGGFNVNVQLTVDATGRVTNVSEATGNHNYPIFYKAAIVQDTNAVLGFSFSDVDAPAAVPYEGSNGAIYAVAAFTETQNQWMQDHFYMPDDWDASIISLDIYWRISATTGNVTWTCQMGSLRGGVSPDLVFNSIGTITTNVPGTTLQTVKSRIISIPRGGILAGDEVFFKFARSASDTSAAQAELISIKFNLNRDFALAP